MVLILRSRRGIRIRIRMRVRVRVFLYIQATIVVGNAGQ